MSDLADRANDEAKLERARLLTAHRNRRRPDSPTSGRCCSDCGQPIPPRRLAAHPDATRCIEDARRHEQRLKHLKRH